MTRDGAVSVNLVTGETTYPSDRAPEQGHSASSETAGTAGKAVDRVVLHHERKVQKKRRKKQRRAYREGAAAASRPSSRLQFPRQTRPSRSCKGSSANRTRQRTGWMLPGTRSPIRGPANPTQIRCPVRSRRQAPPSTARSGRWSRKTPASSRATWGNAAWRKPWALGNAVSRTGGRNAN